MLLKVVFRSPFFYKNEKDKLLQRERQIDFGDQDDIEGYGIQASLPDNESKNALFDEYCKYPTTLNPKKMEASAKHFYNSSNLK